MPCLIVNVPTNRKCAYYLNHDISIYKIFVHYDLLPLDYEDQIGIGSPQIWMWVSAAVEEIIPEGSYRRFLLLTASFTDSDSEIDGAGKIGFAVEENKDTLALEARDVRTWNRATFLRDLKI